MKRVLWMVACVALLIPLGACRRADVRTVTVSVPQARNEACAKLIANALSRTDGIALEALRFEPGKVTVKYDSMKLAIKNIEHLIAEAGFDANDTPAVPAARDALPAGCK